MMVHDGGTSAAGELGLGRNRAGLQVLVTLQIEQRICIVGTIKLVGHKVHDDIIPIFAAKAMIAVRGDNADVVTFDLHDGDVEGSTAKVEYEYRLVLIELIETISQSRRGRLIDNLEDIESGELAGSNRGGAFGVVKICRHGNDSVCHRLLQILFRVSFELF